MATSRGRSKSEAREDDAVPQQPQTTPLTVHPGLDHSFTLQLVMELQKSVGELNSNVQALKASIDTTKAKVDDLVRWKHMILGGAVVLGAVVSAAVWVGAKVSDYVQFRTPQSSAATPAQQAVPVVPPPAQPAKPQ